jgi:thiol:disulfide interchange protein DsbC
MALCVFVILLMICASAPAMAQTPEESLKKNFPTLPFDGVHPSEMKGLYEVTLGTQILYYAPETEMLFVGEIIAKGGRNITRERKLELIAQRMKDLPLDKALKIGSGKNTIIEFSDPDCGHCRKASDFFSQRTDVTRYVFFFPLSQNSELKVRYILCAPDRVQAYKDAYGGKLDREKLNPCNDAAAGELLKTHKAAGRLLGIDGTPFFFVNGKIVAGADLQFIEKLLDAK